jgi:hypothetical protein
MIAALCVHGIRGNASDVTETKMQTRIKIAFQAMDGMPEIRGAIEEHVGKLEQRHGPVRGCGVTVKGPGKHRAGLYEVKIHIALTQGLEVDVGPPPQQDERYADLTFAVNDTFRRARRRLQDHIRRMHEQRKKAERQPRVRAAEGEPREIAGAGIPRAGSTVAEPGAPGVAPPVTALCSPEPASDSASVPAPAETGNAEPANPAAAEAAAAEPPLAETENAEPTPAATIDAEPTPADVVEAQPLLAETASAEPTPADVVEAEPLLAETENAEPTPADVATAEPLLPENTSAEPATAATIDAEPATPAPAEAAGAEPLVAETRSAEPTPADVLEAEPLLAETQSAEPATADVVEAEPLLAETENAEPARAELPTTTSLSDADAETTETDRRDLWAPAPAAAIDPLAFVTAMGSFVRAAAVLNTASTNLMNSCLTYSAGIFSSMMKVKPSTMDNGVKPEDAPKP